MTTPHQLNLRVLLIKCKTAIIGSPDYETLKAFHQSLSRESSHLWGFAYHALSFTNVMRSYGKIK